MHLQWSPLPLPSLANSWCLQVRKLQDKVSKCQDNVKKSKDQYELAVSDINNYNSRYQEVNKKASTGDWPWLHKWLFLRIWRMYLNVVRGRRPSGCRHLKTLYSKFTNVWTSAKTRRKLKQAITGHAASWLLTLLKVTADIRWILSHRQQCWSWERLAVVVQHSRCQYAHGLASVRGRSSDQHPRGEDRYNIIYW